MVNAYTHSVIGLQSRRLPLSPDNSHGRQEAGPMMQSNRTQELQQLLSHYSRTSRLTVLTLSIITQTSKQVSGVLLLLVGVWKI